MKEVFYVNMKTFYLITKYQLLPNNLSLFLEIFIVSECYCNVRYPFMTQLTIQLEKILFPPFVITGKCVIPRVTGTAN